MSTIKREKFIDIAKGIGILLVILGHLNTGGQYSRNLIYAFHMPLFFLLSGVFSNTNIEFKQYFLKNLKRIYVPFATFLGIDLLFSLLIAIFNNSNIASILYNYLHSFFGVRFFISNRPLWFLFALFFIQTVYYYISKSNFLKLLAIALGVFVVATCKVFEYKHGVMYIIALPCLSFYVLGDIFRTYILTLSEKVNAHKLKYIFATTLLLFVFVFTSIQNETVDMSKYVYGNWMLFFTGALLGSFVLLVISVFFSNSKLLTKWLTFFGENTIIILVTHYYLCRILLPSLMTRFGMREYLYSTTTQIVVFILVAAWMVPTIRFSDRNLKLIFGKRKG